VPSDGKDRIAASVGMPPVAVESGDGEAGEVVTSVSAAGVLAVHEAKRSGGRPRRNPRPIQQQAR